MTTVPYHRDFCPCPSEPSQSSSMYLHRHTCKLKCLLQHKRSPTWELVHRMQHGMQGCFVRLVRRGSQVPGADIGRDDKGVEDTGAAEALAALCVLVALLRSCPQLPLQLSQLPAPHEAPVMTLDTYSIFFFLLLYQTTLARWGFTCRKASPLTSQVGS